jgi:hypothetical protein
MAKLTDLRLVEDERPNLPENAEEDVQNRNDKENTNAGSLHHELSVAGTPLTPFLLSTVPIGKLIVHRTGDTCFVCRISRLTSYACAKFVRRCTAPQWAVRTHFEPAQVL